MTEEIDHVAPEYLPEILRQFSPPWMISCALVWGALWRSEDGKHWWFIHAPTAAELAGRLATADTQTYASHRQLTLRRLSVHDN